MRFLLVTLFALLLVAFVSAIPTSYSKNQLNSILKQIQMKKDNIPEDWYGPEDSSAYLVIRNPYLY